MEWVSLKVLKYLLKEFITYPQYANKGKLEKLDTSKSYPSTAMKEIVENFINVELTGIVVSFVDGLLTLKVVKTERDGTTTDLREFISSKGATRIMGLEEWMMEREDKEEAIVEAIKEDDEIVEQQEEAIDFTGLDPFAA